MVRDIHNTTVCVVGGAGFLGSHLVNHLINDRDCTVIAIDNLVSGRKEYIHSKAIFEHADITASENALYQLFKGYDIQYVFNYAAQPYIPLSFNRPSFVFNTNATGAINVINAAHDADCKGILQVSSAEIYGDCGTGATQRIGDEVRHLGERICEDDPVAPHSTYGASKAAVDYYCQTAWRERETPVIALRQFNCVGERETHPYIIPEIVGQLSAQSGTLAHYTCTRCGEGYFRTWGDLVCPNCREPAPSPDTPVVRLGNNSTRDFLYAGDAVRMAVELLEHGSFGEVYNLGSQDCIKMYDLAEKIATLMGFSSVQVEEDPSRKRPWEIWHLQSDNTKINSVVKYRPRTPLDLALLKTIEWYQVNGNKWGWEK